MSTIQAAGYTFGRVSVAIATLGLSHVFANAATNKTLREAQPSLQAFRQSHTSSIDPRSRKNVENFIAMLDVAKSRRDTFIEEIEKVKIPFEKIPDDRIMTEHMAKIATTLVTAAASMELYTFSSDYAAHIKSLSTGIPVPESHTINIVDEKIIDFLDKSGVTNSVMEAMKGMAEHLPQGAVDVGMEAMHELMLPGVMTAITTSISEIKLAFDGDTDWEDSVLYGVLPAAGVLAAVKAGAMGGAMVDAAAAGTTLGLGTVAGGVGGLFTGLFLKEKYLEGQITDDKTSLQPHVNRIKAQHRDGIRHVNQRIKDQIEGLSEIQNLYPHLTEEKSLKDLFKNLASSTQQDLQQALHVIGRDYQDATTALPKRGFLEHIFFFDKHADVRRAYSDAANEKIDALKKTQKDIVKALNDNPAEAAQILLTREFFINGQTHSLLNLLEGHLQETAKGYDASSNKWSRAANLYREKTHGGIVGEYNKQQKIMTHLREEIAGIVNPLRKRIKGNCRRLGRPIDPIVYV